MLSRPARITKSTTTPPHTHTHSPKRHPSVSAGGVGGGGEKPQTSFLFRQFVFPNASVRPFTISACFALLKPPERSSPSRLSNVFVPLSLSRSASDPSQTPSGLLLAHSPLLSGIHFWSSLSPVAPLSPARLQGHSSLFQV